MPVNHATLRITSSQSEHGGRCGFIRGEGMKTSRSPDPPRSRLDSLCLEPQGSEGRVANRPSKDLVGPIGFWKSTERE